MNPHPASCRYPGSRPKCGYIYSRPPDPFHFPPLRPPPTPRTPFSRRRCVEGGWVEWGCGVDRGGWRGQARAPRSCLGPVYGGGGWRRPPSPCEAARGSTGAPACAVSHVRVSARVVGGVCACAHVLVCVCVRVAVASFSGSVFCAQGPPRLWLPARSVVVRFGSVACFIYDRLCIS